MSVTTQSTKKVKNTYDLLNTSGPIDESVQQKIIEKFDHDIESQFKTLRAVMLVLCTAWVILICSAVVFPSTICSFVDVGTYIVHAHQKSFVCPDQVITLIRVVSGVAALAHIIGFAFLITGFKILLKLGFYTLLLPCAYVANAYITFGSVKASHSELLQLAAANGRPAIAVEENSKIHENFFFAIVVLFLILSSLFHYLCGSVYSSREELRSQLQLLCARKYKHKSV